MAEGGESHYAVLGITAKATAEEIKAAYMRLSKEAHPDRNGSTPEANARFARINVAYRTLKDADARAKYDEEAGFSKPKAARPASPPPTSSGPRPTTPGTPRPATPAGADPFAAMMGDLLGSSFGVKGAPRPKSSTTVPPPNATRATNASTSGRTLELTYEEAYRGGEKSVSLSGEAPCDTCKGTGKSQKGRSGLDIGTACIACGGKGRKRTGGMSTITIPSRTWEGRELAAPDGSGSLRVILKKHDRYERDGNDLSVAVSVPYTIMVLGGNFPVQTLDGSRALPIPAGTPNGERLRMPGLGLPKSGSGAGDLWLRLNVAIPREISPRERQLLVDLARLRNDPIKGG